MTIGTDEDWPQRYAAIAQDLHRHAPSAAPLMAGFNACVDAVHHIDADGMARLLAKRDTDPRSRQLVDTVWERIAAGRGGEVFIDWPSGSSWVLDVLGEPARHQVGGTGPQAAWAWAELGAPAIVALADRSRLQLDVLHPDTYVCESTDLCPVGRAAAHATELAKPRHHILEFTAGTTVPSDAVGVATTLPRSSRIILRFADDGIERDEQFADHSTALCTQAYAGLVSGLNGLSDTERDDRAWLRRLADRWRAANLALIHLELAEYSSLAALRRVPTDYAGVIDSLGMSLSELRALCGTALPADPAPVVRDLAVQQRVRRVSVHADDWALSVFHERDSDGTAERAALLAGNLLAAARAYHGRPVAQPTAPTQASYAEDRPGTQALGQGWYAECVPAPYLPRPTSTIGLGDTFVAGLLLAPSLRAGTTGPLPRAMTGRGSEHQ